MKNILLILFTAIWSVGLSAQDPVDKANNHRNLQFTENKGQWDAVALYQARLNYGNIFVEKDRLTIDLFHPEDMDAFYGHQKDVHSHPSYVRKHAYQMIFENYNPEVKVHGKMRYAGVKNYLIGNDPSKWGQNAGSYAQILYDNLWNGIDMKIYQSGAHLKYEFIVEPGVDVKNIQVKYDATHALGLKDNELKVPTSVNTVNEKNIIAYQYIDGKKIIIPCNLSLNGHYVSFEFPNGYDDTRTLIIDPVLTFSTYTGSRADNFGFTATYDDDGHLYAGGIVFAQGYPVTLGASQQFFSGAVDIGITKFTKDGSNLIYSTYLGGSGVETPNSLVVNSNDELVVLGNTSSTDFPTSSNGYDGTFNGGTPANFTSNGTNFMNGTDIIVTVLSNNGNNIVGSTYLGGSENDGLNTGAGGSSILNYNYSDLFRGEVVVDENDNIYLTSTTHSADFPVSPTAIYNSLQGEQDAVVMSLTPDVSSITWSTFLGGSDDDAGYSLKLDTLNKVFVTGGTTSNDFPTTSGAYLTTAPGGQADGYLIKIENGNKILGGTFLGTSGYDQTFFVEIDEDQDVYLLGQTDGNYPVTPGVYNNNNGGQFITKMKPNLSSPYFSTRFGKGDGNPELVPTAFLVDWCKNIYVSGWGGATNGNSNIPDQDLAGMPVTMDAYQPNTDGSDFYFFVLSKDAVSLKYATYFGGGNSSDHVDGGTSRFDKDGIVYQSVCASCGVATTDFPTTPGAYSQADSSQFPQSNCNLAAFKFEFQLAFVEAEALAGPETEGCGPLEIIFENNGTPSIDYLWDFDDGNTSTDKNPSHTFTFPGTYEVSLIAIDNSDCNSSDTAYLTVDVYNTALADFEVDPVYILPGDQVSLLNNSKGANSYLWDLGNGTTSTEKDPQLSYPVPGTYEVCLVAKTGVGCDDSLCKEIVVSETSLIDVPNAFSPNDDKVNDILYVKGYGVEEMVFKLFNRWGELIFETNNLNEGWDGTFKGQPQEMDVYVYTLKAKMESGEVVHKKGDITLIR